MWDVELPVAESVDYAALNVVKMPDGDFMIGYLHNYKYLKSKKAKDFDVSKDRNLEPTRYLFFAAKKIKFDPKDQYYDFLKKAREEGRLLDRSVELSDSSGISEDCGDFGVRTETCHPLNGCYAMTDKDGKVHSQKKILYVYSKPVRKDVDFSCEGTEDYRGEFYNERVHFLEEMTYYTVDDDTFIVVGFLKYQNPPSVVIIRFDKNFKTKSDIVGKKVFMVAEDLLKKMRYKLGTQVEADQVMYNYLMKLKKGGK